MENRIENPLSFCSGIAFGDVNLSDGANEFCSEMNDEVISFCKSLPESTQADALLFFMRYFRIPLGQDLSFFSNYYAPAWSIIYWLIHFDSGGERLEQEDKQNAKMAHSMALLLHPLDDHLNDGQIPVTHITLLIRSQCWMIMNAGLNRLAEKIDGGKRIVQRFIDDYYSSIKVSKDFLSLDSYCNHFRRQMATWLIVPVLMTKIKTGNNEFSDAIQTAYESFGIAWRLLDDINDIQTDMMNGAHSSIYICLPEDIKNYWDKHSGEGLDKKNGYFKIVLEYILENSVIGRVRERICSELESAASIADDCKMTSWAAELLCLLRPLQNSQD